MVPKFQDKKGNGSDETVPEALIHSVQGRLNTSQGSIKGTC